MFCTSTSSRTNSLVFNNALNPPLHVNTGAIFDTLKFYVRDF